MARVKTLYVRDEDSAVWEAAAKAASEEGVSLSEFVVAAVRERVDRRPPAFEELSADSMEPYTATTAIKRIHKFMGRWIVKDARSTHPGAAPQDMWSVAITEDGFYAVHVLRAGRIPLLGTGPKLDVLARTFGIPDDVVATAVEALGKVDWIVRGVSQASPEEL